MITLQQIIDAVHGYMPNADVESIRRAYNFAQRCFAGKVRESGDPYAVHVTQVAYLATKLKLDVTSIVAALLHDVIEDTDVTAQEIQDAYGKEVATLVGDLTKLNRINFNSKAEQQAESFRKMLLAIARDIRVLLIKLCDRLHNMRTVQYLSENRRVRIAQETIDIYVPLTHRLGIYWMKSELEDLCFQYLKPAIYSSILEKINQTQTERDTYTAMVIKEIMQTLESNGIHNALVSGRAKTLFSIYRKMEIRDCNFSDLYDLLAFRVIVPTVMECYQVLGILHTKWKPMSEKFKDYIAMPKSNNYQSLHTAVIGPSGFRIEIQIRTKEMNDVAERGIAAHWFYKETGGSNKVKLSHNPIDFNWLKDLLESEQLLNDPLEFMSLIKDTLFKVNDEVYVFSPKGDLIELPNGATPIDFAFFVHSEVGLHCKGARVNGLQVPISYKLKTGDTVEIITAPAQKPSRDWLHMVASGKARQRIRQVLKLEEFAESVMVGRELLMKEGRKYKINFAKVLKKDDFIKVAQKIGYNDVDSLLVDVGYGKVLPQQIFDKLIGDPTFDTIAETSQHSTLEVPAHAAAAMGNKTETSDGTGVKISGMDRVVFRFARCCEPLPGDEIVGFVTRGRGVAIHKRSCEQVVEFDPHRLIDVQWDSKLKISRNMYLRIITNDVVGLLAKLTQCIADNGINILSAKVNQMSNRKFLHIFKISLESTAQAEDLIRKLEYVDGVLTVERGNKFK